MLADRATKENLLTDVISVFVPGSKPIIVRKDNGIRVSSMEKLSQLKPAFVKSHGTITAGGFTLNSKNCEHGGMWNQAADKFCSFLMEKE